MGDLSTAAKTDANNRRIVGPATYFPAGTRVGSTDYAIAHVLLVDASNNALVVATDLDSGAGTANRVGVALLVPASGGPATITGDAANGLDVDVTRLPALAAGTNAIGKLAANSGVDIGDVDVTSLPFTAAITYTHSTATATTSSSAMLASNGSRKYALLQNIGAVDVYIKVGATAVASQGILLPANGGSFEMSAAYGNLATGAVNGITASGSATVLVTEG